MIGENECNILTKCFINKGSSFLSSTFSRAIRVVSRLGKRNEDTYLSTAAYMHLSVHPYSVHDKTIAKQFSMRCDTENQNQNQRLKARPTTPSNQRNSPKSRAQVPDFQPIRTCYCSRLTISCIYELDHAIFRDSCPGPKRLPTTETLLNVG